MQSCEACNNGIGESWEDFVASLTRPSSEFLELTLIKWWKNAVDWRLAGCKKHAEAAADRRDYVLVERDTGLFSSGKDIPNRWLEGRNKIREKGFSFWHPPGVHDGEGLVEDIPKTLLQYRVEELDHFCFD